MNELLDVELLRDYAESGHEAAFRELVTRHTDFVFSAALRQVDSPDLAGDIAQSVFSDLARKAQPLAEQVTTGGSLAGWLHRSTRYAALNHWRDNRRRLANERLAMEQLLINSADAPDWEHIRPVLDEALDSLDDEDRESLLLRYFKNQDFREVGRALGISDDAAQKRVSRALDRLRDFFSERNVTIGASGLAVMISANAVQAAPVGLVATISAAAIFSTTAVTTSTLITTSTIATMTTLQKILVTATIAVVASAGIYEAHQASKLRAQNQLLRQQQTPLADQLAQLQRERDDATNRLAGMAHELAQVKKNPSEVLKLRGEVGVLRQEKAIAGGKSAISKITADPETRKALRDQQKMGMSAIYSELGKRLKLSPEQTTQFNDLLADSVMDNIDLITQTLHDKNSRREIDQMFAAQNSSYENKVQAILGADGLEQFKDYTKNLGMTLSADQFAGNFTGDKAEKDEKKKQLLQSLTATAQSALAAAGLPADYQLVPMLNFRNIASEEIARQNLELLDGIYGQVATSAGTFLTPEEINKFQDFRTNAINVNKTMLLMNRNLMAPIAQ